MTRSVALEELFLVTASLRFRSPRGASVWLHRARDGWVITDQDHLYSPMRFYNPTPEQPLFREDGEPNSGALVVGWLDPATSALTPLSRALELAGGPTWGPLAKEVTALERKYTGPHRVPLEVVDELRAWAARSGKRGAPLGGTTPSLIRSVSGITVRADPGNSSLEVVRDGDGAPCLRTNLQGVVWEVHTTWPAVHEELKRLIDAEPPLSPAPADPWIRGAPFPHERGAYWLYQRHPGGHWGNPSLVTVLRTPGGDWVVRGLYDSPAPVDSLYEPRFLPLGEVPAPPGE